MGSMDTSMHSNGAGSGDQSVHIRGQQPISAKFYRTINVAPPGRIKPPDISRKGGESLRLSLYQEAIRGNGKNDLNKLSA